MRKEVNPSIIIPRIVVVISIIGFFAFRMFFASPNDTPMAEGSTLQKNFEASQEQSASFKRLGGRGGRGGSGRPRNY